jgi:hypothetical protein
VEPKSNESKPWRQCLGGSGRIECIDLSDSQPSSVGSASTVATTRQTCRFRPVDRCLQVVDTRHSLWSSGAASRRYDTRALLSRRQEARLGADWGQLTRLGGFLGGMARIIFICCLSDGWEGHDGGGIFMRAFILKFGVDKQERNWLGLGLTWVGITTLLTPSLAGRSTCLT